MLSAGESAPDFELPNQDGELVRLSDCRGHPVVLYFYPKAGTDGCTTEACSFRDNWDRFEAAGVQVVGVSTDPVDELAEFKREQDLPFPLLSDEEGNVARTYETFGTPEIDGEQYEIALRNTYVIDENGDIDAVYEDVSPEMHAEEILDSHADGQ